MDKNKVITMLTTAILTVGAIAIVVGAVVLYRKYQLSTDGLTYSVIVVVVLYFFTAAVLEVVGSITDEPSGSTDSGGAGSNMINNGQQSGEDDPFRFRRPVGMIPSIYDPENVFTDIHGHEYRKLCGVWWDDNGNICPDYLKDIYGISSYEKRHEDDQ